MTSKLTRERIEQYANDPRMCNINDEIRELARMALAAMDSEPFAYIIQDKYERERGVEGHLSRSHVSKYVSQEDISEHEITCTPLYRHAQPVPVVLDAVDTNLIEALRLVQCMLDDYRERNYGDAQGWIRHINTHMSDYTEAHGDDAYSVLHNLITAAPQSTGSEPAAVPGKWIPVSERMPEREVDVQVYCPDKKEQMVAYLESNELEGYFRFATWRTGDGIYCQPTHWMQLPAGPKEVKGE